MFTHSAGDTFNIESFLGLPPAQLIVRNTSGQIVRSFTHNDSDEFSVRDLPAGMYIVTVQWDEISATEVLVVE